VSRPGIEPGTFRLRVRGWYLRGCPLCPNASCLQAFSFHTVPTILPVSSR